jgi:hypothetical protein
MDIRNRVTTVCEVSRHGNSHEADENRSTHHCTRVPGVLAAKRLRLELISKIQENKHCDKRGQS